MSEVTEECLKQTTLAYKDKCAEVRKLRTERDQYQTKLHECWTEREKLKAERDALRAACRDVVEAFAFKSYLARGNHSWRLAALGNLQDILGEEEA